MESKAVFPTLNNLKSMENVFVVGQFYGWDIKLFFRDYNYSKNKQRQLRYKFFVYVIQLG